MPVDPQIQIAALTAQLAERDTLLSAQKAVIDTHTQARSSAEMRAAGIDPDCYQDVLGRYDRLAPEGRPAFDAWLGDAAVAPQLARYQIAGSQTGTPGTAGASGTTPTTRGGMNAEQLAAMSVEDFKKLTDAQKKAIMPNSAFRY